MEHQPVDPSLPIEPILTCDEGQDDSTLHDVELSLQLQGELASSSLLRVQVARRGGEERWEIARKYEDCVWLFKALKNRFPGTILPYFPAQTVQDYIEARAKALNVKLHKQLYAPRVQELAAFLATVCRHALWGKAREVQVFLLPGEEFLKQRTEIDRLEAEAKMSSKSFNVYSFFSRGISWLANKEQQGDQGSDLLRLRFHLKTYSTQLSFLLQKFNEAMALKSAEMAWSGTSTEIDSVERVRARILSGRPFVERFISEVEGKMIVPLVEAMKAEAQLEEQLQQREEAGKLLEYAKNSLEGEEKTRLLAEEVQTFDKRLLEEWPQFESQWKQVVGELDGKFRTIWREYSQSMARIWK